MLHTLIVIQSLQYLNQLLSFLVLKIIQMLCKQKPILIDSFLHQFQKILGLYLLYIELIGYLFVAAMNITTIAHRLKLDHLLILLNFFDEIFIYLRIVEILEVFGEAEHISAIVQVIVELFHIQECFFTEDEHCDSMIGFDGVEAGDKWRYEFKDKHNVISSIQIHPLVLLQCLLFLFFHIGLIDYSSHVV